MSLIRSIFNFISSGVSVFRKAARGEYVSESPAIDAIRRELEDPTPGYIKDREALLTDRDNVCKDVYQAFNAITR